MKWLVATVMMLALSGSAVAQQATISSLMQQGYEVVAANGEVVSRGWCVDAIFSIRYFEEGRDLVCVFGGGCTAADPELLHIGIKVTEKEALSYPHAACLHHPAVVLQ